MGQKVQYIYTKTQMQDKEKTYRDANSGIVIQVHKQLTALQRWLGKATPEDGDRLLQHIQQRDSIGQELDRLTSIVPPHRELGYNETEYGQYKTALRKANGFSLPQVQSLLRSNKRAIDYNMPVR